MIIITKLMRDEQEYHWCRFCRTPAYYYVDELEGYVCAECYRKIKREKEC